MKTLLIILVLLLNTNINAQDPEFTSHTIAYGFNGPGGVATADLNNDGFLDVIAAGIDNNTIAWWLNPGEEEDWDYFRIDTLFVGAIYVDTADINGDGLVDILGAAYDGNELAWWENNEASPEFWTKHIIIEDFTDAHEIMGYDVDKDNDMDILGVSAGLNQIIFFENIGGNPVDWIAHIVSTSFGGARSVDAMDIDNDGDIDLAGAALTHNKISWWRNDGGYPIEWTQIDVNTSFIFSHKVQIVDMDGDQFPDILGTAYNSGIKWWENDGGDSIHWTEHHVDDFSTAVIAKAIDLDQDNDMDIVGTAQGNSKVGRWENLGNNSLEWGYQFVSYLGGAWPLALGDFDNDMDMDFVAGGNNSNQIKWFENEIISNIPSHQFLEKNIFKFQAYPNPFKEHLSISINSKVNTLLSYSIYNNKGAELISKTDLIIEKGENQIDFRNNGMDIIQIPSGIYYFIGTTSEGKINIKLVKN